MSKPFSVYWAKSGLSADDDKTIEKSILLNRQSTLPSVVIDTIFCFHRMSKQKE